MFERLLSFLKELPGRGGDPAHGDHDDPRLAAAALMVHVLDSDGVRSDREVERLRDALAQTYEIEGRELDGLIAAAEEADREAIDLYAFTSVLKRHLDETGRARFIGLLWEMVYADGVVGELEDNIVWRVAELIGVENRERIALRQRADAASRADADN